MKDGLSQDDRVKRIEDAGTFTVIDHRLPTLLRQVEAIAGFIRYYDLHNRPDGCFDQFLDEIKQIRQRAEAPAFDGNMEPAQALIYTFLRQLNRIGKQFNRRWKEYGRWYINDILKVRPETTPPDSTRITFAKNVPGTIVIKKGTSFTYDKAKPEDKIYYRTAENIEVNNIGIKRAHIVNFEKDKDVYPANVFNCPARLKAEELSDTGWVKNAAGQSPGLGISSPALLLREGKRTVTISFISEDREGNNLFNSHPSNLSDPELFRLNLLNGIFRPEISTTNGWSNIKTYSVKQPGADLILRFELDETFPKTTACTPEIHGIQSEFPRLRIYLNPDAWLFPYFWLKDFRVKKINIRTKVEGIADILFYNELGRVDISKPFPPFGLSSGQDAWFVLGNYEMAVKNLRSMDVNIAWQQLPKDDKGLYDHYRGYDNNIDNTTFKLRTKYLHDYRWTDTAGHNTFHLFASAITDKFGNPEPQCRLAEESALQHIQFEGTEPVRIPEEEYDYGIRAQNGFTKMILAAPEMGFGEQRYRRLFTEQIMKRTLFKKSQPPLNPPINPLIERITLSYEAVDEIDMTLRTNNGDATVYHIYPLGEEMIYPAKAYTPQPFVFSLDTDENILLELSNVQGGEYLHLYFVMNAAESEYDLSNLPQIHFFWGDGYRWKRLPDDAVLRNTTRNMVMTGFVKIRIPATIEEDFQLTGNALWIRIGIVPTEQKTSPVSQIFTNVVKVYKDTDRGNGKRDQEYVLNTTEKEIPGITKVIQITPFSGESQEENYRDKSVRVSEYITHRGRAVTARDYERMTLQAFPAIKKVKCFWNSDAVTLMVIPGSAYVKDTNCPGASAKLLSEIEEYFTGRNPGFVPRLRAINPVYETLMVRCDISFNKLKYSNSEVRAVVSLLVNRFIAPWQRNKEEPVFGYTFPVATLFGRIGKLKQVQELSNLSVIQFIASGQERYIVKEYTRLEDVVAPSKPYAVLIPAAGHLIVSGERHPFGINEMTLNENLIIWPNETEKP